MLVTLIGPDPVLKSTLWMPLLSLERDTVHIVGADGPPALARVGRNHEREIEGVQYVFAAQLYLGRSAARRRRPVAQVRIQAGQPDVGRHRESPAVGGRLRPGSRRNEHSEQHEPGNPCLTSFHYFLIGRVGLLFARVTGSAAISHSFVGRSPERDDIEVLASLKDGYLSAPQLERLAPLGEVVVLVVHGHQPAQRVVQATLRD